MSNPGDKYTVCDNKGPLRVLTVASVVRKKAVMTNGSEWEDRDNGAPWQLRDRSYYRGEALRPFRPEHEAEIARRKLVAVARKMTEDADLARMPDDDLRALIETCRPWQKGKAS